MKAYLYISDGICCVKYAEIKIQVHQTVNVICRVCWTFVWLSYRIHQRWVNSTSIGDCWS